MSKGIRYSDEVRSRAIRMVQEHEQEYESQWAAIGSIAQKIGCSAETLRAGFDARSVIAGAGPASRRNSCSA